LIASCAHFGLLAAAAEDERIAPLEAHHPLAGTGQTDQEGVDLLLGDRVIAGRLADRVEIHLWRQLARQCGRREPVKNHRIRLEQALSTA